MVDDFEEEAPTLPPSHSSSPAPSGGEARYSGERPTRSEQLDYQQVQPSLDSAMGDDVHSETGGQRNTTANAPSGSNKNQAAFVHKLRSMLDTAALRDYIGWSQDGCVFSIYHPTRFAAVVLPQFFKHSNWQSFVRQLNMYGFRKVNDIFSGAPTSAASTSKNTTAWEFQHVYFQRDHPENLIHIKRKSTKAHASATATPRPRSSGSPRSSRSSSVDPPAAEATLSSNRRGSVTEDGRPFSSSSSVNKRQRTGWKDEHGSSHHPQTASDSSYPQSLRHSTAPSYDSMRYSSTMSKPYPGMAYYPPHLQYNSYASETSTVSRSPDDIAAQMAGLEGHVRSLSHALHQDREGAKADRVATSSVLRMLLGVVARLDASGERRDELEQAHAALSTLEREWSPTSGQSSGSTHFTPSWGSQRPSSSSRAPIHASLSGSHPTSFHRPAESFARRPQSESDEGGTPSLSQGGSFSTVSSESVSHATRTPSQSVSVNPASAPRPSSSGYPGSVLQGFPNWGGRLPPLASLTGVGEIFRRSDGEGGEGEEGTDRAERRKPW